ncbi:hypothetical protein BJ742DRAFT_853574 [Cladochytrium replicatum]|nr:hypothetical protein BJ742DRAFT_853574 [Cladochytrium replicatum]
MALDPRKRSEINELVREYLLFTDYRETVHAFDRETHRKDNVGVEKNEEEDRNAERLREVQERFLLAFNEGDRDAFFALWDEHFPPSVRLSDPVYSKLEFTLSIYFAVFPVHSYVDQRMAQKRDSSIAMDSFKAFLETRGADLCKTTQFLSFYALPYVPNPMDHPTFRDVFTDGWVMDVEDRLSHFLSSALKKNIRPQLIQIVSQTDLRPVEDAQRSEKQLTMMKRKCQELELHDRDIMRKHRAVQNDYQNLLSVAQELVHALGASISGAKISVQYLSTVCDKLAFLKRAPQMEFAMDLNRDENQNNSRSNRSSLSVAKTGPNSAPQRQLPQEHYVQPLPHSSAPSTCQGFLQRPESALARSNSESDKVALSISSGLDYAKLRKDVATRAKKRPGMVLRALRKLILMPRRSANRHRIIHKFARQDILQCNQNSVAERILDDGDDATKVELVRFLNAFSLGADGREYVSVGRSQETSKSLVTAMVQFLLNVEKCTPPIRENILGAFQKLSLRRRVQSILNSMNVLDFLHDLLENTDGLSERTIEYATALLMNLCLRTEGKRQCLKSKKRTLAILNELMEHESVQIKTYVNGALFSLFSEPKFREEAREMGMEDMLDYMRKTSSDGLGNQLEYVMEELNSSKSSHLDELSEDGEEADQDADDESDVDQPMEDDESDLDQGDELEGIELLQAVYLTDDSHTKQSEEIHCSSMAKRSLNHEENEDEEFFVSTPRTTIGSGEFRPTHRVSRQNTAVGAYDHRHPLHHPEDDSSSPLPNIIKNDVPHPPEKPAKRKLNPVPVILDAGLQQELDTAFQTHERIARTPVGNSLSGLPTEVKAAAAAEAAKSIRKSSSSINSKE